MFDTLVRGGRIIDPSRDLDQVTDIGIQGARVAAIGDNLLPQGVRGDVIDASGLIVTPGWIDLHTHVYWGVAPLGVEADPHCIRRGVTTAVDAGSAGASTFPGFKRYVIDVAATRVVAMLHLSVIGMARDDTFGDEAIGELEDIRWANVERALDIARTYADCITGVKVRMSRQLVGSDPEHSREVLRRARQVADAVGKPVMVHPGNTAITIDELLGYLIRGDIVTHLYHDRSDGVLDTNAKVRQSVRDATQRGVHFDVGHGAGSFSFSVARAGMQEGLLPDTISSDIHAWNIAGPVYDLVTTASKFLHLGMPLTEVIRRVTTTPAACIGRGSELGTLQPGAAADLTVVRSVQGEFQLRDSYGNTETGGTLLQPVMVLRNGQRFSCN